MVDSFITYDSTIAQPESPGYFRRHFDQIFTYQDNNYEQGGFVSNQNFPPINPAMPSRTNYDAFSNDSTYSTNPSTKHSPEHTPNMEEADDDRHKHSIVPPIIKKGIRKYYEPIVDGGVIYRYEEDPNEYKKARKRIQNRESATRVRNRKKTHVEILEDEIQIHKQEKNDLKIQNSSLIAENSMLKQQIAFLESMVAKSGDAHGIEFSEPLQDISRVDHSDSMMQLGNNHEEELEGFQQQRMYRVAPSHNKVKKHMVMLGVFTLLLCVYGLMPGTQIGTVSLFASSTKTQGGFLTRPTSNAVDMKPSQRMPMERGFDKQKGYEKKHHRRNGGGPHGPNGPNRSRHGFRDWLESQTNNQENDSGSASYTYNGLSSYSSYLWVVELLVVACYVMYLAFVGWTVYKHRSVKKERKTSIINAI